MLNLLQMQLDILFLNYFIAYRHRVRSTRYEIVHCIHIQVYIKTAYHTSITHRFYIYLILFYKVVSSNICLDPSLFQDIGKGLLGSILLVLQVHSLNLRRKSRQLIDPFF